MSLSRKIVDALDATPTHAPCQVSAEDGGRRLSLDLAASGPVGLAFTTLRFFAVSPEGWSPEGLADWAEKLKARVTYLMEPLSILEHDQTAGELILRSQSPTGRAGRQAYFEIRLDREGTLTLRRMDFDDVNRRRQPIPCQMTREVLERLTDDLVAVVR
jgi:hypothetical protein